LAEEDKIKLFKSL